MDFIINNYLWFIIGGILIFMIVIGYFAEKTDFGRKPLREKKRKDKIDTAEELTSQPQIENKGINDVVVGMSEFTPSISEEVNDENIVSQQEKLAVENDIQPNQGTTYEKSLPEVDFTTIGSNEQEKINEDIVNVEPMENFKLSTEDLAVPFGDNVSEEEVKVEIQPEPISEVVEVEQGTEEDEVWRF